MASSRCSVQFVITFSVSDGTKSNQAGGFAAQAIYFPLKNAIAFLSSHVVQNYRHSPPKSGNPAYPRDGLTGIDSVIGRWAESAEKKVYAHTPSLCQHIGVSSAMWKSYHANISSRFSDDFPGQHFDCSLVYPRFLHLMRQWNASDLDTNYCIHAGLWALISSGLKKGVRTLELCPGLSTLLFHDAQCNHTCLTFSDSQEKRFRNHFPGIASSLRSAEEIDSSWTSKATNSFDVAYVSYPRISQHAQRVTEILLASVKKTSRIYVEGTNKPEANAFSYSIAEALGWDLCVSSAGQTGYCEISSSEQLDKPPLWRM